MQIHLDTDFGGDPDDACALAFLLGSPDVAIVGISTNLDVEGRRAGCVAHYLKLARRSDIPVAAGAGATLSNLDRHSSTAEDRLTHHRFSRRLRPNVEPLGGRADEWAVPDLVNL